MKILRLCLVALASLLVCPANAAEALPDPAPMPPDYYAEPVLPFDETTIAKGEEDGWSWREFHYTSLIHGGQAIRIHAVYALPKEASAQNRVPAIVMTHGKFGQIISEKRADPRYWAAVGDLAKAGYAVLFFEWNPDPARKWKPATPGDPQHFSSFGTLDYSKEWRLGGNDWKDSLYYQVVMAGRRAVTWISARPEVDASRIGTTGASFGGIFSSLLASVEPRIVAVAATVYTAGFGPDQGGYNNLPKTWSTEQMQSFRARFDSEILLKTRPIPVLYTLGTKDSAFSVLKGMRTFREMPPLKHLVLNPNQEHGFWNFPQTLRFFDGVLKGRGTRPQIGAIDIENRVGVVQVSVPSSGPEVEFFYALEPRVEPNQPPYRGNPAALIAGWKWAALGARRGAGGSFEATLALTAEQRAGAQNLHVFARAKNEFGIEECAPIVALPLH